MITIPEIEKLASLSRISLTEDEKKRFQKEIEDILSYVSDVQKLSEDESEEKAPGEIYNVFREDEAPHESLMYTEELLRNAPDKAGEYFRVKKIL